MVAAVAFLALNPEHRTGFRTRDYASHTSGGADWRSYADSLPFFARRLYGVVIESRDALGLLEVHDTPDTLHYLDPPYVHGTRASLSHPYRHEMEEEGGASLRGAGYRRVEEIRAKSWHTPSRPRVDKHPLQTRIRWEAGEDETPDSHPLRDSPES